MTTNIGSLAVSLSLDSSNFNNSMASVDRNLRSMGSELKAAKALGTDYGKSLDGLRSKKDILTRSVEASSIKLTEERKKYDELVASGKANEAQLERQAKKVNDAQAGYNRLTTELSEVDKALKVQSSSWTQFGEKMESAGKKMQSIGKGMADVGKDLSMKVTAPIVGLGTAAFKAAVDFESSFAGVRKTVDTSEEGFKRLEQGIRDMAKELPASASDIAAVAESAGQLGIAEDNILSFSKTIIDLGESTNMTREQAATEFARFANIVGMSQNDFDRLGSSIVSLGNNYATTESEIMSMGMRLAAQGAQVGMTEAQIMALAGSMSSLGIQAEMGGTAMTKILKKMQSSVMEGGAALGTWAEVAQMSSEEFKKLYNESAIAGLDAVIKGLDTISDRGINLTDVLEDMGIKGVYESDVMLRMSGASDLLSTALDTSTEAWKDNVALTNEAEQRYKTTASQMKMLWNQIVDVGISIGGVLIPKVTELMEKAKPLIDRFANMSKESQNLMLGIAGVAAAIGPVLVVTGTLTSGLGGLLTSVSLLSGGIAGAGGLGAALAGLAAPVGIAVGAIGAVGLAGYGLYKVLNQTAIPEIDIFGDKVSENTKKAVGGFVELADGATVQLNQLKWSGMTVTKEMADGMIATHSEMGESVIGKMREDHNSQLESIREYFTQNSAMNTEQQNKILESMSTNQAEREKIVEDSQFRMSEILRNATDENRQLNAQEQAEYDKHFQTLKETGIRYLSESEEEFLIINERIKLETGKLNAEQALETARLARETKDAVIQEIEDTYDQSILIATLLKEEGSAIAIEEANNIIAEAERTRDESLAAVIGQYDSIIRTAVEKGDEYVTETELRLGRVLTAWEKLSLDVGKETAKMSINVINDFQQMHVDGLKWISQLRTDGIKAAQDLTNGVRISTEVIPGIVKNIMIEAAANAAKSATEFFKAGQDAAQGLIDGMEHRKKVVGVGAAALGRTMINSLDKAIGRESPIEKSSRKTRKRAKKLAILMKKMKSEPKPKIQLQEVVFT